MSDFHLHQPSGFLLREGESPAEFLDPLDAESPNALDDPGAVAAVLQNELHALLGAYLNGDGFDRWSCYLYPWFWRRAVESHERSRRRLDFVGRRLRGGGPSFRPLAGSIADVLAEGHRVLERVIGQMPSSDAIPVPAASLYERDDYDGPGARYLQPVRDLMEGMEALKAYYRAFFLHGSMATLDYVPGFSDLDTLLVLRRDVVLDGRKLEALRRRLYPLQRHMYRLDPLQHHGFMVLTELDLDRYPESYFPLDLLRYAKGAEGAPLIRRRRGSLPEQRRQLWSIVQWMRRQTMTPSEGLEPYAAKLLTSFLLLLPALFLQGVGEPTYKKFSFERLPVHFSGDMTVLGRASRWRAEGFPDVRGGWTEDGPWPPAFLQRTGGRRLRRVMRLGDQREVLSSGVALAEAMLERMPR